MDYAFNFLPELHKDSELKDILDFTCHLFTYDNPKRVPAYWTHVLLA